MKRRDFITWVGLGAIATSLPIALAACTPEPTAPEAPSEPLEPSSDAGGDAAAEAETTAGEAAFVELGPVTELDQQGYLANESLQGEQVIAIRDPANADTVLALSSKCTHAGCTVAWEDGVLACPCHGSKFNPDGTVANGPANAPLPAYAARIEGDTVLVSLV